MTETKAKLIELLEDLIDRIREEPRPFSIITIYETPGEARNDPSHVIDTIFGGQPSQTMNLVAQALQTELQTATRDNFRLSRREQWIEPKPPK